MSFQRWSAIMNRCASRGATPIVRHGQHRIVVLADGEAAPLSGWGAPQEGQQGAAFQPMRLLGGVGAECLQEGGYKIDRLDESAAGRAARAVGLSCRVVDDEGDLHGRLVKQVLVAHPVVAEVVAVI